jgi:hypothetical protein
MQYILKEFVFSDPFFMLLALALERPSPPSHGMALPATASLLLCEATDGRLCTAGRT